MGAPLPFESFIMKRLNDLEYLKLNKLQAFFYKIKIFFCSIPGWFVHLMVTIGRFFARCGRAIGLEFMDIVKTFTQ